MAETKREERRELQMAQALAVRAIKDQEGLKVIQEWVLGWQNFLALPVQLEAGPADREDLAFREGRRYQTRIFFKSLHYALNRDFEKDLSKDPCRIP